MDRKLLIISAVLAAVLIASPASAVKVIERCVDANTVNATFSFGLGSGGNSTEYTGSQSYTCASGCSYTLNACRPDSYNEALMAFGMMGGILAFCAFSMWVSMKTETGIYVIMLVIASVLTVIIAITDVFSILYRTMLFGFAFVPGIFILFARQRQRRESIESPLGD